MYGQTDRWTDTQNFRGYNIIPCHFFLWWGIKKVKGKPKTIISTNLIDLESLMLYTLIQPQSFLGSGEEDF